MISCAVKFLFILFAFNGKLNPIILATAAQNHDTFSSLCQDQMVKLGSNIYHLDRLTASLNSDYFEKLFTSDDFKHKNDSIIEMESIENDEVFPIILDLIHGKKRQYQVLNEDNYFSLLKAMNHFGMEIYLENFDKIIEGDSNDAKIFELYDFIKQNRGFDYLLNGLFKQLSKRLDVVQNISEKTSSSDKPLDHLVQLIRELGCLNEKTRCHVVPLCATLLKLTPKVFGIENSNFRSYGECDSDNSNDDEERERYTTVNSRDIRLKSDEFRENGDFCDFMVRIKDTTFKLHRRVLESVSGYFTDIFRAEYSEAIAKHNGTLKCPRKDKEYILSNKIDPSVFNVTLRYLYRGYSPHTFQEEECRYCRWSEITQAFIISHILRIDSLSRACEIRLKDLKDEYQYLRSENVGQILDFTHGKPECEDLYVMFMVRNLNESWPKINNMSQFCSVNWTLLEKILMNASHFVEDDPNKIVEIYSKWTSYNARNRYQLLPRIARIINPSCVVNDEEYTTDVAEGLHNQSQQFVRAELWKILSSLPYTICSEKVVKNTSIKLEEIPVFIATESEQSAAVLNFDLDVITSMNNSDSTCSFEYRDISYSKEKHTISATLIGDNLFIIYNFLDPRFQVYNFLLKKCFRLHLNLPGLDSIFLFNRDYYVLLNCNDEIYACSKFGQVAKYSMQFNRWTVLPIPRPCSFLFGEYHEEDLHYTSDGKMLYRTYKVHKSSSYKVETFDFEKNLWGPLSGLPLIETSTPKIFQLSMVNDHNFIVSSWSNIIISDRNSTYKEWHWKVHEIPLEVWRFKFETHNIVAQCEDRLLLLMDDALYRYYPSNGSFELNKKFPKLPYYDIRAIDRHLDVGSKKSDDFLS
ncbi:uncharacterized protein LOC135834525 [Planococcus citri]|uniref:uncharacterized protein LOC135834525 n=1 Tax=Planococcus citri TaxID=170843 RepID=UPI0031F8F019